MMCSLSHASSTWPGHCVVLYSRWGYSISVIRIEYTHSYLTLVLYRVPSSQPLGYSFSKKKYISTVNILNVPKNRDVLLFLIYHNLPQVFSIQ